MLELYNNIPKMEIAKFNKSGGGFLSKMRLLA